MGKCEIFRFFIHCVEAQNWLTLKTVITEKCNNLKHGFFFSNSLFQIHIKKITNWSWKSALEEKESLKTFPRKSDNLNKS